MPDRKTIAEAFADFHAANPRVYGELVALAREARRRGAERIGIRMVWEVMRWNLRLYVQDESQDSFRLNDHYHSRYARLIMEQEPDLDGIFELRKLRSHGPNRLYDVETADGQAQLVV